MLDGDWNLFAGQYFDCFDRAENVVITMPLPESFNRGGRVGSLSTGDLLTLQQCMARYWRRSRPQSAITYREYITNKTSEGALAEQIASMCESDEDIRRVFLSPDAFAQRTSSTR